MANLKGDSVDNICCIKYATTSIKCCALGTSIEGGTLIYKGGGKAVIVAPRPATPVCRIWDSRGDAVTVAQAAVPCGDWYIPNWSDLITYVEFCGRNNWDTYTCCLWSDSGKTATLAWAANIFSGYITSSRTKTTLTEVRAFRNVYY